jgi:NADH:ubiquinone oxidoreductase subunit 4 (subunit M)
MGAVVAIGGYVLAKAGLPLLPAAGSESSLSPFMIGLVGIVYGLLAKEVIDTIALRGRDMLKRDETHGNS